MLLAVDVGNTNTVVAVFQGETLALGPWRMSTDERRTDDEVAVLLSSLFNLHHFDPLRIKGCVVASVVPNALSSTRRALSRYWDIEPLIVSPRVATGIKFGYASLDTLGADRLVNAVAGIERCGCPLIVVDLGTATKVDAVSRDGEYLGGAIAPGIAISERALFDAAAQLPRIPLIPPPNVIGRDTVSCLQSGLLYGHAGLLDGLVMAFRRELGSETPVIATGGFAGLVAPLTQTIGLVEPNLTLAGLRLVYERNEITDPSVR